MRRRLATIALAFAIDVALYLVLDWLAWRWTGHPARSCRMCGCTDARACEGGCWWVSDDFCSRCLFGDEDDEPGGGWQG